MSWFNKLFRGDKVIWMVVALLSLISLLAFYSSSERVAHMRYDGDTTRALISHAVTLVIGLVALYVVYLGNYRFYIRIFSIALYMVLPLLLVTTFAGENINGASRVVNLFGVSFQTSDLAKVALIGYLARALALNQDRNLDLKEVSIRYFLPILLTIGLIFTENLSTAAILFMVSMYLIFVGNVNFKFLSIFVAFIVACLGIYVLVKSFDDDAGRTTTWLSRFEIFVGDDPGENGTEAERLKAMNNSQDIQAKLAVASGGLFGKLPGKSTQRNFLQHPYSDFIFSIIVEEYGLVGGVFVMILYLILLYRAGMIMQAIPRSFGGYVSFGLAALIVTQAFIHIGVAVSYIPITGQPLPFISKGGSSMLFTGISLGIILSVSKDLEKKKERMHELEQTQNNN